VAPVQDSALPQQLGTADDAPPVDPLVSEVDRLMEEFGAEVCDIVVEAAMRLLLHLVNHEINCGECSHAAVALFFVQTLARHEDAFVPSDGEMGNPIKAEWYEWLRFPPLLDLLDTALGLPGLERQGIVALSGYSHIYGLVSAFQAEAVVRAGSPGVAPVAGEAGPAAKNPPMPSDPHEGGRDYGQVDTTIDGPGDVGYVSVRMLWSAFTAGAAE
jgi:hypothetical protein